MGLRTYETQKEKADLLKVCTLQEVVQDLVITATSAKSRYRETDAKSRGNRQKSQISGEHPNHIVIKYRIIDQLTVGFGA